MLNQDDLLVAQDTISENSSMVSIAGKEETVYLSPKEVSDNQVGSAVVNRTMVKVGKPLQIGEVITAEDGSYTVDSYEGFDGFASYILYKED